MHKILTFFRKIIREIKREIVKSKKTADQTSEHDQAVLEVLLENGMEIIFRYVKQNFFETRKLPN